MSALDWILGVGALVLGVINIAGSERLSDGYRRNGRRGWANSRRFFIALGGFWLLVAALAFADV